MTSSVDRRPVGRVNRKRKSAGSKRAIMACYMRMEKGGKGRREQPLASASERIGVTGRKTYKPIRIQETSGLPQFTLTCSCCTKANFLAFGGQ